MEITVVKIRDDRQMRALTGLSISQFEQLLAQFGVTLAQERQERYEAGFVAGKRQRKPGGGSKGKLPTVADKLYFILYYLKRYPTFDDLATTFDMARSKAHSNVYKYWPLLERTLHELAVTPERNFESVEAFREFCTDLETLFIDVTERSYRRPQDNERQREYYSGKKKRHGIKNTVMGTPDKYVVYLGPTVAGRQHDYTMLKTEFEPHHPWFDEIELYVDLGYLGIRTDYDAEQINVPHRKPRKSKNNPDPQLTAEQITENQRQSRLRVVIENAIAGIKRYKIVVDRFRNRLAQIEDRAIFTATSLWNFHLLTS